MTEPDKICARCGRRFAWRKRWAKTWDRVQVCSDACRRVRLDATDHALEAAIEWLLAARPRGATICPSEAARAVLGEHGPAAMEQTRRAARRLVAAGRIEITQRGRVVDPSTARGPIRLRRAARVASRLPEP
jgi:hypothetical protein